MITVLTVVIILTCAVLAFFVLIQNPKGGGLSGSFGSMSSQIMGVKQSSDVMEKGIVMSGGSSQLRNLDGLVSQATGVACYVADEPLLCVAKGTGIALENLDSYKRSILATR